MATATAASTKLRPLGDRVVIKPTPREEMTKSGIVLPDTAKEKPQEGQILAVGPGAFDNEGKRGFTSELGPETDRFAPPSSAAVYKGRERDVRFRARAAGDAAARTARRSPRLDPG